MKLLIALFAALPLFAADITGSVYTDDGTPISGATVTASNTITHELLATTKTDAGEFTFSALPDAVIQLEIQVDDHKPLTLFAMPGPIPVSVILGGPQPSSEPRAKLNAGDRTLTGTVRVGGKPVAGLPVIIQSDENASMRVFTDAKGRYTASAIAPGRYVVAFAWDLHPNLRWTNESDMTANFADLRKARTATLDLDLTAPRLLHGRVLDADAKPVAGAQVQIILAGRSTLDFAYEASVRTMKDGRYVMAAPPYSSAETTVIAVAVRGYAKVLSKPFTLGTTDRQIDVTLPRFESVTLRLADREGKPVPKARVAFASAEETAALRDPAALLMPQFAHRTLRTDDAGEVVLHLTAGAWDFAATAENFQTATLSERMITRPATVALTLERAFAIRGRVHRGDQPVVDARIHLMGSERVERNTPQIETDANGAFEIGGLAPGKYKVAITKSTELLARTVDAEAPSTIDVELPPAGVLRVHIVDAATREPVRDFVYTIEPTGAAGEVLPNPQMAERDDSSEQGRFEVTLSRGTYRVSVNAAGYASTAPRDVRISEREPAEVTIALERGITLSGRVTDENGTPVAEAAVFVQSAGPVLPGSTSSTRVNTTDARSADDGSFTVSGIEARHVAIDVRKEGFVPLRQLVDIDETPSLEVKLMRGLTLEGIVRRAGKAAAGAQVDAVTSAFGGSQQSTVADANGRFVLPGLVAARYTVSAFHEERHTQVNNVDPSEKRELVLSLDPQATGILFGTVTGIPANPGGKLVRRVVFAQSNDSGVEGLIDESGSYRIEDAPSGTVFVTAQVETPTSGRSSVRKSVEVTAGQALRVDLDVTGAVIVRGHVTNEGKPAAGVRVVFVTEAGLTASASSRADGGYEVGLAAAGTYQVFAHSDTLATGNVQLVREVNAGDTVDIELREQTIEGTVIDAITREPLRGISITLAPGDSPIASYAGETFSDAGGRFRLRTASTGAYRIIAWGRGYAHRALPVQLGAARAEVAFELSKTEELRVHIVDAKSGAPLSADLTLQSAEGMYLPIRPETSSDQSYVYSLAAGKYKLTVAVPGYADRKVDVTSPGDVNVPME